MPTLPDTEIRLTEYAHGAGCGCKIAPQVLQEILQGSAAAKQFKNLLVGHGSNDDAAVYDLGNGQALVSTADFFMPIVDDAFDFGRVAAANAISDVYAMGGQPVLALAILGWPVNKLPASLARRVMEGARAICSEAGIPLAGGHSIDTTEPMFGLAVNGLVKTNGFKRNDTARAGDLIYMTKPLGTGILATAQKRKLLKNEDKPQLLEQLTRLNSIGQKLGGLVSLTAMTDITGFGLLGHLIEMAEGSGLTAQINYTAVPRFAALPHYLQQAIVPDATYRNWNAYQNKVLFEEGVNVAEAFMLLPDPQTNGGLLFTVAPGQAALAEALLSDSGLAAFAKPVGEMLPREEKAVRIKN